MYGTTTAFVCCINHTISSSVIKRFISILCPDQERLISRQHICWIAEWRDIISINEIEYTLSLRITNLYHTISSTLL